MPIETTEIHKVNEEGFNLVLQRLLIHIPKECPTQLLKIIYNQGFIDATDYMTKTIGTRLDKLEKVL